MQENKKVISIISAVTLMSLGHNGSEKFFFLPKWYIHSEIKVWSDCNFTVLHNSIINIKVGKLLLLKLFYNGVVSHILWHKPAIE